MADSPAPQFSVLPRKFTAAESLAVALGGMVLPMAQESMRRCSPTYSRRS